MRKLEFTGQRARNRARGITLIELMIVIVVVAVLAAIAYPNYSEFVARAKRNEAKAALLQIATNQEKNYLQNSVFTTDLALLGFSASPTFTTDSGAYDVTVSAIDPARSFTATATFKHGGAEAGKCLTFTIDGAGRKTSGPDTDCWTRTR